MRYSLNYDLFIGKLLLINAFKNDEGISYKDISFIFDTDEDIIQTYDTELLQKMGINYYRLKGGALYD